MNKVCDFCKINDCIEGERTEYSKIHNMTVYEDDYCQCDHCGAIYCRKCLIHSDFKLMTSCDYCGSQWCGECHPGFDSEGDHCNECRSDLSDDEDDCSS